MNESARKRQRVIHFFLAAFGMLLFASGLNFFIQPLNFYSGGFIGMAQLIRDLLQFLNVPLPAFDISGIIYYLLNIPVLFLAYKALGKFFFIRTIMMTSLLAFFTTVIPIPAEPIIHDPLTAAIAGGVLCGIGSGLNLYAGYSAGGLDVLGLYLTRKSPGMSVGRIGLSVNMAIFSILAATQDLEIVVYSFIYNAVINLALDKVHIQNINVWVMIFTKQAGVDKTIMTMGRGVTSWNGAGAYTGDTTFIHTTMISKAEIRLVRRMVLQVDPKAFIITTEGSQVTGGFIKKL